MGYAYNNVVIEILHIVLDHSQISAKDPQRARERLNMLSDWEVIPTSTSENSKKENTGETKTGLLGLGILGL